MFQHLNALLEGAVEYGLIARNPARGVKLPAQSVGELVPRSSKARRCAPRRPRGSARPWCSVPASGFARRRRAASRLIGCCGWPGRCGSTGSGTVGTDRGGAVGVPALVGTLRRPDFSAWWRTGGRGRRHGRVFGSTAATRRRGTGCARTRRLRSGAREDWLRTRRRRSPVRSSTHRETLARLRTAPEAPPAGRAASRPAPAGRLDGSVADRQCG